MTSSLQDPPSLLPSLPSSLPSSYLLPPPSSPLRPLPLPLPLFLPLPPSPFLPPSLQMMELWQNPSGEVQLSSLPSNHNTDHLDNRFTLGLNSDDSAKIARLRETIQSLKREIETVSLSLNLRMLPVQDIPSSPTLQTAWGNTRAFAVRVQPYSLPTALCGMR